MQRKRKWQATIYYADGSEKTGERDGDNTAQVSALIKNAFKKISYECYQGDDIIATDGSSQNSNNLPEQNS